MIKQSLFFQKEAVDSAISTIVQGWKAIIQIQYQPYDDICLLS